MRLRLKIDPHDYETKKGHVERFLRSGDKVKITVMFRGREQSRPEMGYRLLQRLAQDVAELGVVESNPKQDRSEEHTSELQSRQYLVCRLLLEKKQNPEHQTHPPPQPRCHSYH